MKQWDKKDINANELVDMIVSKQILVPQYQRGQVWKNPEKEQLIDSIKKGYPFGTLLMYSNKEDNKYRLIDGLQRSTTLAEYLNNPSKIFSRKHDVNSDIINKIVEFANFSSAQKPLIAEKISEIIERWVINSHENMDQINNMQYGRCVRRIIEEFPIFSEFDEKIENLLEPMLQGFKDLCKDISTTPIPAIVYTGPQENLPEIFKRINQEGKKLTKYQVLAATWSHVDYKIKAEVLKPIHQYVEQYFTNIYSEDNPFEIEINEKDENTLNLFQVILGFSKILSDQHKYIFNPNSVTEVESAGFNLLTACVGLRNNKMDKLDARLNKLFKSDAEFNIFLEKVLIVVGQVEKLLKPYISFKLNSRSENPNTQFHTEFQMCSIISNVFIAKHASYDQNNFEGTFSLNLETNNREWKSFERKIKKNLLKRYLTDILSNVWRSSGDNRLYESMQDSSYYTSEIDITILRNTLFNWYENYKIGTNERKRVANPNGQDKLILSIIYSNIFTSIQSADETKYDIEHLAPKKQMITKLNAFDDAFLPISSIGNICLLPEYNNRRKREFTLYQDSNYIHEVGKYELTLHDIEKKYTFTTENDLLWLDEEQLVFEDFKASYIKFIDKRFENYVEQIIEALYSNKYI